MFVRFPLFRLSAANYTEHIMPTITKEMLEKRAASVRTGGKGSVRRTSKAKRTVHSGEEKKVQATLKKLGVTPVGDVEEAIFVRADGSANLFKKPSVQASMQTQCFVVSGAFETIGAA